MADRYWIATSGGSWTNNANWSTTSGGAGGASYPTSIDNAIFDQAGTYTVTLPSSTSSCLNLSNTAGSVTFSGGNAANLEVSGNFLLQSTATWSVGGVLRMVGSGKTVTTNGVTIAGGFTVASSGTVTLQDNLTQSTSSSYDVSLTSGTFAINGKTVTCKSFSSSNTSTRTLDFGTSGGFILKGTGTVWNTGTLTNLTITKAGSPFVISSPTSAGTVTLNVGAMTESQSLVFGFQSMPSGSTITFTSGDAVGQLQFTSASGACTVSNVPITIYGTMQISGTGSTNFSFAAGSNAWTFTGTTGSSAFNLDGNRTFDFPWVISGTKYWEINNGNIELGSTRSLTHNGSTLNLNGRTFAAGSYITGAGTKELLFNGGTLTCIGSGTSFDNANPTNFTTTAGTGAGKISMTSLLAKTFNGGGSTFNCTLSNDGAGAMTISGSNTFTTLANGVQPTTFTFTSGTTTTVTNWNISGTASNLVTIGSTSTSQHTLSKASGTVNATNLNISYSNATGGATWNAGAGSVDSGNNTGWVFQTSTGNFLMLFQ